MDIGAHAILKVLQRAFEISAHYRLAVGGGGEKSIFCGPVRIPLKT